ncbi:MAG TPA: hypothetical protein VHC21_02595 [Candidatus Saccharimonadales bacterium]|nr:hypothetical protein [Candidatus Saccharimonadales bacterium]
MREPEKTHLRLFFNVYLHKDSVFNGDLEYTISATEFNPRYDESLLLRAVLERLCKLYGGRKKVIEKITVTPFCIEIFTDRERCRAANVTNYQIRQTVKAAIRSVRSDYAVAAVPL